MTERRTDRELNELFPEMPESFSKRIDLALDEVRSGRVRRSGRSRSVFIASACAAAFVLLCGAALLSTAWGKSEPVNIALAAPTPSPTAEPIPQRRIAEPSEAESLPTAALTPKPAPTQTPRPEQAEMTAPPVPERSQEATVAEMAVRRADELFTWYDASLAAYREALSSGKGDGDVRTAIPDFVEQNADTELWFYEEALQEMLLRLALAEPAQSRWREIGMDGMESGSYGYVYANCSVRTEYTDGTSDLQTVRLTLDPQQKCRVVGIERGPEHVQFAWLRSLSDAAFETGMTRSDANRAAFADAQKEISERLALRLVGDRGEFFGEGRWQALPTSPAEGQAWRTAEGELPTADLLRSEAAPLLPALVLPKFAAVTVQNGAVAWESFRLWAYDGDLLTEVGAGTPEQLAERAAALPAGRYLMTFGCTFSGAAAAQAADAAAVLTDAPAPSRSPAAEPTEAEGTVSVLLAFLLDCG